MSMHHGSLCLSSTTKAAAHVRQLRPATPTDHLLLSTRSYDRYKASTSRSGNSSEMLATLDICLSFVNGQFITQSKNAQSCGKDETSPVWITTMLSHLEAHDG